jgi:hypothetical protein
MSVAAIRIIDSAHKDEAAPCHQRDGTQNVTSIMANASPSQRICLNPIVNGEPDTSYTKLLVVDVTINIPRPLNISGISHSQESIFPVPSAPE